MGGQVLGTGQCGQIHCRPDCFHREVHADGTFFRCGGCTSTPEKPLHHSATTDQQPLQETAESDIIDFLHDFAHWGKTLASSIGNLTCVLQDLELLTEDREVNIDSYLNFAEDEGFDISLSYAKDPAFLKKMQDGYSDCYEISQSWPASSLNRNPLTKVFGRQHIFFKCAHKLETKLCAMGQMVEWLEKLYGKDPNEDPSDFGLPKDRYDAAAISIAVLDNAATPEEKFLDNFFWGDME